MELSSIIFGLIVTALLFLAWSLKRTLNVCSNIIQEQALKLNQLTIEANKVNKALNDKLTESIAAKMELENQLEHLKGTITNLRRSERKHVATIKKLAGE